MLTARRLCEQYARIRNLEEPPEKFIALLHIDAQWRNKWFTKNRIDIEFDINRYVAEAQQKGLRSIELVSGYDVGDGRYVHCTVSVPIDEPDKHVEQTTFSTDGGCITGINSYYAWLAPHWPYPDRLFSKLRTLVEQGMPIAPLAQPEAARKLRWPEDGRNYPGANISQREIEFLRNWNIVARILGQDQMPLKFPPLDNPVG